MIRGPDHRPSAAPVDPVLGGEEQRRAASPPRQQSRQQSGGEIDPIARRVLQTIAERPAYFEDVPSDAAKSVLELVVQDAEQRKRKERDLDSNRIFRWRYYSRRLSALLVESDRRGLTLPQRLEFLRADPYIARVTPELNTYELDALRNLAPHPRGWLDVDALKEALDSGPFGELAFHAVRDTVPPPSQLARFTQTPDKPVDPRAVPDMQRLLLFFGLVRSAPPTWNLDRLLDVYNAEVTAAHGAFEARHMSREELDLMLAETPWVHQEYENSRFHFRNELKAAIADAPVGRTLGDVVRDICRYPRAGVPGYALEVSDVIDYIRGDAELQRLLNAQLGQQLLGTHAAVLPRLARWVHRIFGDALHDFSLLEISDRMRQEDPAFTPSLVAELFVRCPQILGTAPEADTRRNFLLAVTVATTMQKMWAGASYEDVVAFLKSLGPHADVPPGFDVKHLRLLQGYDFVPVWEGGKKSKTSALERQLGALAQRLERPLGLLRGGLDQHIRDEAAAMLATGGLPDRPRIEQLVAGCFRPTASSKAVALMERYGGGLDHAVVNQIVESISAGRYDELLDDPVWRTAFRPPQGSDFVPAGAKVPDQLVELLRDFRDGERSVVDAIELAMFRANTASAAMDNLEKIPRTLPITQKVVEAVKDRCRAEGRPLPFANARVVMIQHELGQAFPQVEAYRSLGMDAAKCIFVGKPYHPNPSVEQTLLQVCGVDGRFSRQGDLHAMHQQACAAVDEAIAKRAEGEVVLVVGDGPWIRDYVERQYFAKDPSLARWVRFTEQTAIGHRKRDVDAVDKRVISYARLYQKLVEAPYIGRAGRRAAEAVLTKLRDTFENKLVWVNGIAGPIGRAAAEALQAAGARVAGWDPELTPEARAWAEARGMTVHDDDSQLPADVFAIAGAAGDTSGTAEQIDKTKRRSDGGPVYYISFSSERVEFDYGHLQHRATDKSSGVVRKMVATMVNDQPTFYYWFDDGTVRAAIADTLPVNFQDVNSVAPEAIDATMALSIAAGAEALESDALGFFSASTYVNVVQHGYAEYLIRAGGVSGSPQVAAD